MNKPDVSRLIKSARTNIAKHSPEILTGIGIAGMISTTILAVRATPKALRLIELEKEDKDVDELSPIETIKTAWKPYIPAAITCVTSTACLIGASSVSAKRNAVLATAYTLSETALKEYKNKVVETIGEKKEQAIREKIDKDHVDQHPISKNNVIITNKGHTLCLDYHNGRYFESDIETIRRAENEINRRMLVDSNVSLNEFYDELGLEHTMLGDELGWRIDDGFVKIDFSSQLTDDGEPCLVMNYRIAPRRNYYKMT